MDVDDAFRLIDKIDTVISCKILFESVHPDVIHTLDDVTAGRREIERIEPRISEAIALRLKAIAGSVFVGSLRRGQINNFYDVVCCLGTLQTKSLLVLLSNQSPVYMDREAETIFARSYATSVVAEILAGQTGYREDGIRKAALCGLFLEVGRRFMIMYKKLCPADASMLDDSFIDSFHPYLGEKIAGRYSLPDYVKTVILVRNMILEEDVLSLAGIVHLAHNTVVASFRSSDNKLVLKCQVPRPGTDVTRTLEAIIAEKFRVAGLENYLHIIRIPRIHDF